MFKKLRDRFLLLHMGVVSLLVLLFFGSVLAFSYADMERGSNERLALLARNDSAHYSITVKQPEGEENMFYATPVRMAAMPAPGIRITLTDNNEIDKVQSAYPMGDAFYTLIVREALRLPEGAGKVRVGDVTLKFRQAERDLFFIDVTRERELLFGMLRNFLLIALPLIAFIFGISAFFARVVIRPIEAGYNRQREFVADASHELKTPLTAMAANVEVLASDAPPEQQKWLAHIKAELNRMGKLTGSLLSLAKLDADPSVFTALPLDFSALVADCLLPLDAVLYEQGKTLTSYIGPGIRVKGDREQLIQLTGILMDNALRYGKKEITVRLKKVQAAAELSVENDGPNIAPDKLSRIWERFYRGDDARPYDGGFGLGLSMAKAITERHKGRISCESKDGATKFTVWLP